MEGAGNSSLMGWNSSVPAGPPHHLSHFHLLAYILLPLGTVLLICALGVMITLILKKRRISRLRHYLLPTYHFEAGEDGGDWEEELLEEERQQQAFLRVQNLTPPTSPRQKLYETPTKFQ